ncbi:FAS1 domain-containing protein [Absidia repens]|uniref:FAS1 domain-containing protein n=1 Tax=Absidia repens TaxID=90262 RepID=A0A1X2IBR5_9FUNG|nr:FAS1 domain-containing protein [Absidia repens]
MLLWLFLSLSIFVQQSSVLAYQTIIDVLSNDARFGTLIRHIQKTRLVPVLNALETGTFFAPDNDAFANYQGPPITNETLLYHLLPRKISAEKFRHHQVIESSLQLENYLQNNTGQRLLIHRSPNHSSSSFSLAATLSKSRTTLFVNDAQMIDLDVPVNSKTVIHAVNKILQPPQMISQTFTHGNIDLYQMMDKVGLIRTLNQHQPFTVFYSDQSILQSFSQVEIAYLLSNYGDQDLFTLLGYLIIHGDIYADDFSGEKQYKAINGDTLKIKVDKEKNTITVNDELIIQKDILAANGVLHRLETMPITHRLTFDTRKYLYGINATKFVSLLDEYDLGYYLAPGVTNFTVLAPDNNAINEGSIPDNVKKAWLSYHILHGRWDRNLLKDRLLIESEYKSPQLKKHSQVVPVYLPEGWKSTIYFGNARVHGDSLAIKDNMIYQLSNPMDLPHDVFSSIVIDLDLSSFIATLYVSEVVDQIKDAAGITLFAPTNQAYKSLGLVATYLLHPNGRGDLQATLQHHAAQALLYDHDLRTSTHNVTTLTGQDTLSVGGTDDQGRIMIGSGSGSNNNNNNNGTILHTDTLMANGVIHKIDTVIIPSSVSLTHRKILRGMDAHRVLDWFNDFPWLGRGGDDGNGNTGDDSGLEKDYILLVPTDRAFAQMDEALGAGWENKDRNAYERLVRLHVIPKEQQKQRHTILGGRIETYPTLLSDRDRIIVHDGGYFDEQYVQVEGKTGQGAYARILAKGHLGQYAQVIQMDTVLMPVSRGLFGLPWIWSVALVSILILVGVSLLGGIGYYLWQRYRRSGYEPIEEEPEQGQSSSTINNNNNISNNNNHDNNTTTNNTTISNEESGNSDPHGSQYPSGHSGQA